MFRLAACLTAISALSLSACQKPADAPTGPAADAAAVEGDKPLEATAARTALVEAWQSANPGVAQPPLEDMVKAFDPAFERIANAENDADNAFIKSTLAFIRAVQADHPALCAEAPIARFSDATLAAVPAEALPALRAMLTDRLAVVADGASHTAPSEDLMSGSMQGLSVALGDSPALELLPQIASGATYDATAGCAATIQAWEAFDKGTQSPQLMKALYSGEL